MIPYHALIHNVRQLYHSDLASRQLWVLVSSEKDSSIHVNIHNFLLSRPRCTFGETVCCNYDCWRQVVIFSISRDHIINPDKDKIERPSSPGAGGHCLQPLYSPHTPGEGGSPPELQCPRPTQIYLLPVFQCLMSWVLATKQAQALGRIFVFGCLWRHIYRCSSLLIVSFNFLPQTATESLFSECLSVSVRFTFLEWD